MARKPKGPIRSYQFLRRGGFVFHPPNRRKTLSSFVDFVGVLQDETSYAHPVFGLPQLPAVSIHVAE
ncbi:hypothetical protein AXF42_Ash010203 [Apostasia shenzhenica]|uniref:Uncharacterized protein n=1 Tax=Apostasia shenzhenica TaxID=1088818 RepID=A0A2I0A9T5_9ASPA|nr:hypothetical protein AXF42_Ash010203 [Apostasia shenzhenica]